MCNRWAEGESVCVLGLDRDGENRHRVDSGAEDESREAAGADKPLGFYLQRDRQLIENKRKE